jgi:hypothetical protein
MTAVRKELRRRRRPIGLAATLVALAAVLVFALGASPASLPGSNFEIDGPPSQPNGSNLIVNGDPDAGAIDWVGQAETRRVDLDSGRDDDSYAGGSKEDDACPGTTTGSIPNNKSDLKTFGAYTEGEVGGPGFLNLFWHRVNDPSGTTLMDFELNHESTLCANGVNPIRTEGDLLIEYRIDQGGAVGTVKVREWNGSAWGAAVDLTGTDAIATIQNASIPAAQSDGLVPGPTAMAPRTFGEMQLDLDFIFDEDTCESFGSAFVKSRSSDSFTSQLKDFIKPIPINLTNCGTVIIRKQTNPDEDPEVTEFDFTKSFDTDPATEDEFTLMDDGVATYTGVLFGDGYTVTEDALPAGWDFASLDCSASENVTPVIPLGSDTVTFDIDNAADVLDCTYTNRARGTIIVEKITDDGFGAFQFTSTTLSSPFTLTTTAAGAIGKDADTFSDLAPGTYDVAETVPVGWNLVAATTTCDDGSDPASISLSGGETVTCTFHNARERGAIDILKLRKHAAAPGTDDVPHPGVTFTITGGSLPAGGVTRVTDANGHACVSGLVLSSFVGNYTVTETVPAGYHAAAATAKTVTVSQESAGCGPEGPPPAPVSPDADVSFLNIPLTNIVITVDSQVDGGTASTIDCDTPAPNGTQSETDAVGDGGQTHNNLEPGTYTCTVVVDP